MQNELQFPSDSPINTDKLGGQNKRLYDYLKAGNRINCMDKAMSELRIGYLNSRCSDLRNKFKIPIQDKFIEIEHNGEKTTVKQYWL